MKKKQNKVEIRPPFDNIASNWELIDSLESSLTHCLASPHLYTNLQPSEETERLGRGSIEAIVKAVKAVLLIVESLRAEQKNIDHIKLNAQLAQEKLEQHEEVVRNYERKFSERTKALVEENRMLKQSSDKMKKAFNDSEDALRVTNEELKQQCQQLQVRQGELQAENKKLLMAINELQEEVKNQKEKNYRLTSLAERDDRSKSLREKVLQLQGCKRRSRRGEGLQLIERRESSFLEWMCLNDVGALSKLLCFLTPRQICTMCLLNRQLRLLLLKSRECVFSLGRSVSAVKNRRIRYYHRHIEYFEKLYNRIPQEVLQLTYFKYHVLKENVGQQIMAILNSSATIFEGKFLQGEQLYAGLAPPEQQLNFRINLSQAHLLAVDEEIVEEYRVQRSSEREKLMKLFESMYGKISNTFQLYRADLQSSRLFVENILKHFSKVFVLSKNLYLQAQNLQQLNAFLLSELNKWDRMEIDKTLQLQDLRAELEAEKKLKLFFTDKSIKSEQKALIEENLKLTFEMKYNRLTDLMNVTCAERDELLRKNEGLVRSNEQLGAQVRESQRRYESVREKHQKVTEQLAVVRETIIKMNIV